MRDSTTCTSLLITSTASGQGKTTVTAALARKLRSRGQRVRVFKVGPDFIDPTILECASGAPVYQLDVWMGGEAHCRELLADAAAEADVILIEGVMGLFDGKPCSADLAALLHIPLLAVLDATGMAQTFGALAYGLAHYRRDIRMLGLLANRVASENHYRMLMESLPPEIVMLGCLGREKTLSLPERYLGLVTANDIGDLDQRLDGLAEALKINAVELPKTRFDKVVKYHYSKLLPSTRIAVARDAAFSFIYRANVDVLRNMGAELIFFSPLADKAMPTADALYLPGGYPELHMATLSANEGMKASIWAHHRAQKPIVAECGGMLYLAESLTDAQGNSAPMLGVIPGQAKMQKRFANLGMQSAPVAQSVVRGHTFHYSNFETTMTPSAWTQPQQQRGHAEAIYKIGRVHASYFHMYFPSNHQAVASLFAANSIVTTTEKGDLYAH